VVEFGEHILTKQVEEDTTTFTNFKGE